MTLTEALEARYEALNPDYRARVAEALDDWRRTGMGSGAKHVGDHAPDFTLSDDAGRTVTLSSLLAEGPVVLSFFRGEWCPFCRLEMEALLDVHRQIREQGARLVMVSPQPATEALQQRVKAVDGLILLRDTRNGVGLQYGLVFRVSDALRRALLAVGVDLAAINGDDSWFLPVPATYVIGPDGTIALAHLDPNFTRRTEPSVVLDALARLT